MNTQLVMMFGAFFLSGLFIGLNCALASERKWQQLLKESLEILRRYEDLLEGKRTGFVVNAEEAAKTSAAVIAVRKRADAILNPYESPKGM